MSVLINYLDIKTKIKVMKKVLLSALSLALTMTMFGQAQKAGTGAKDDFSTTEPLANGDGSFGVYWFENTAQTDVTLTRNGDGTGTLSCTDCGGTSDGYASFIGLGFGDDNGDLAGGNPHYLDLSSNADIKMTIKNNSTTDSVAINVQLEDADGDQADLQPNISTVTSSSWGTAEISKSGLYLAPGETATVSIDLTNGGANVGGLSADASQSSDTDNAYADCSDGPNVCPYTSHQIDPAKITKVLLFFEAGAGIDALNLIDYAESTSGTYTKLSTVTPFTGTLTISNFEIGTGQITGIATSVEASIAESITLYPNPTSSVVNVTYDADELVIADVIGNVVAKGEGSSVNVESLASGVYFANVIVDGVSVATKKFVKE